MSVEQRSFRPYEEAWSSNQVAHHLLKVQQLTFDSIEKLDRQPSQRRSLLQSVAKLGVASVLKFGFKVRNPAPPTAPEPAVRFQELEPLWREELTRLRKWTASRDDSLLGCAGMKHPISGPLSQAETLDFLACHLAHHLRQIARLRAHPEFPAA